MKLFDFYIKNISFNKKMFLDELKFLFPPKLCQKTFTGINMVTNRNWISGF